MFQLVKIFRRTFAKANRVIVFYQSIVAEPFPPKFKLKKNVHTVKVGMDGDEKLIINFCMA